MLTRRRSSIKRSIVGYVWAFTSTEIVVYLYHPTREGTFLKETLGDFAGVLVSDFYAAYDSVTCHQQKCHLHLMRDINDDLLQSSLRRGTEGTGEEVHAHLEADG